jgi:hypothetical protein
MSIAAQTQSPLTNPDVRRRELESLAGTFTHPFTQVNIDRWVAAVAGRDRLLHDCFWGTIRWPRSLGRTTSANLANGFSLRLQFQYADYNAGKSGDEPDEQDWRDLPTPAMWEAEDDSEHYRLIYAGSYIPLNVHVDKNRIDVTIVGKWTNPTLLPRYLLPNPLGFQFSSVDGSPIVLEEITVEQHLLLAGVPRWAVKM